MKKSRDASKRCCAPLLAAPLDETEADELARGVQGARRPGAAPAAVADRGRARGHGVQLRPRGAGRQEPADGVPPPVGPRRRRPDHQGEGRPLGELHRRPRAARRSCATSSAAERAITGAACRSHLHQPTSIVMTGRCGCAGLDAGQGARRAAAVADRRAARRRGALRLPPRRGARRPPAAREPPPAGPARRRARRVRAVPVLDLLPARAPSRSATARRTLARVAERPRRVGERRRPCC